MMRETKDSGLEWIGEIPAEWGVSKIGQVYRLRNTKVSDTDYPPLSVTNKGIVPQLDTAAKTKPLISKENAQNRPENIQRETVLAVSAFREQIGN